MYLSNALEMLLEAYASGSGEHGECFGCQEAWGHSRDCKMRAAILEVDPTQAAGFFDEDWKRAIDDEWRRNNPRAGPNEMFKHHYSDERVANLMSYSPLRNLVRR